MREAEDPARLSDRARRALGLVETVTRYQPAARLLDVVDLPRLGRPAEMAMDAVDYMAVRWEGRAEEAVRKLGELGWGAGDHGRLVYWSTRGVPAEWRRVQRTGL